MAISTLVKRIQDIMRKDVGVDGDAQRIGQLTWMLLLKIFDESFASAEKDIEVLTGMKVSHSTQHRRARENSIVWGQAAEPVSELSLDGGKVRLRTAKGEELYRCRFRSKIHVLTLELIC